MKIQKTILCISLPVLLAFGTTQTLKIDWHFLRKHVTFTEKYNESVDLLLLYPSFSETIKKHHGKTLSIKGYMIESEPSKGIYVLSRYPMAQCYFCGGAGPESIVEVQLKDKSKRYYTDQIATVTGTFKLNGDDIDHCNYILENATVVVKK